MYVETVISPVPSAPPKNIVIDNTTVFAITLKWELVDCMYQNGKITEYIIKYHPQDRENETINDTTAILEFTITDLQPYTVYVIGVAAVNDAGIGVYGNAPFLIIHLNVASPGGDNLCTDSSAAIAVSAVSLALNIALATVILILILRIMRRSAKVVLHSSKEMYAVPSVHLDVPVTPNEAYALHQSSKPSEDTTYEMVK